MTGWSTIPLSFHYCSRNTNCIRKGQFKGTNIRGEREVKLTAFADDMTTFLKDDQSAEKQAGSLLPWYFLSHWFSCQCQCGHQELHWDFRYRFFRIIKKAAKLNFESILSSLKKKLNLWRSSNLTVLGSVQIVKTFAIPSFFIMHHNYLFRMK